MDEKKSPIAQLPAIIDGLDFGVVLIDGDLKILWLNNAMERLFNLSKISIQGQDVFTFISTHIASIVREGDTFREYVFPLIADGKSVPTTECHLLTTTGHVIWIEYSSQIIEHGPFKGMRLDIYQDITLRTLLQKEIDRQIGQLGALIEGRSVELTKVSEQFSLTENERKRIEDQLFKEKNIATSLAKSVPVYLITWEANGAIQMIGDEMLKSLHYEQKELLGKELIPTLVSTVDHERVKEGLNNAQVLRTAFSMEFHIKKREGVDVLTEWHINPIFAKDGSLDYFLGVGTDITERMAIEETLKQSESLYRTIFDNTQAAIVIIDNDMTIHRVNIEFEKIFGYRQDDLQQKKFLDLFFTPDRIKMVQYISKLQSLTPPPKNCEFRIVDSAGNIHDIVITMTQISEIKKSIASILDITERKRTENAIEEQNKYLSAINTIITATTSVMTVDKCLSIILNKSIQLLNFDAGAVYLIDQEKKRAHIKAYSNIPDWVMGQAQDLDIQKMPYRRIFLEGQTEYFEKKDIGLMSIAWIPFIANDHVIGSIYFMTSKNNTFSVNDRLILQALSKEVGNVIQKELLREQLEELNTLSNLYLDIMAHDINNTNAISLLYAELLEEMLDGERKEMAKKVSKAVLRSAEIIANVSTIRKVREEKVKLRSLSIDQVIKSEIEATLGAHINYSDSGSMVCADELLSEVFANLIGNSIKFGGPSVQISIEVLDLGDEVEVSIVDSGPGISDDIKPLLFRRFERGETKVKGKGLGLYICRLLVERYGGSIWIEDRVPGQHEKGTAVKFLLKKPPIVSGS